MSVLIKCMEMPTNCEECKIKAWDDGENEYVCPFSGISALRIGRQYDCPLTEEPERKTGRWLNARYPFSKCNQCGAYMDTMNNEANYCCVCGAKMEVEK